MLQSMSVREVARQLGVSRGVIERLHMSSGGALVPETAAIFRRDGIRSSGFRFEHRD